VSVELANDERELAVGAVRVLAVLAVPAAGLGWLAAGAAGVIGSLIGLGLVLVLFGASAVLLALVATRRPDAGIGLLVAGAVGRLALYLVTLGSLSQVSWVHPPSLALATVTAIAVTLAYELRLLARRPQLFWLDAGTTGPSAAAASGPSTAPRSRSL
jgi:hypothetical protein